MQTQGPRFYRKNDRIGEFHDTQTGMLLGIPRSARCVQRFDDSLNSAIHITYRISLRSSSMGEPRDPLSKVIFYYKMLRSKQKCVWYEVGRAIDKRQPLPVHRCIKRRIGWDESTTIDSLMILLQVHLQKPCYDFYFL